MRIRVAMNNGTRAIVFDLDGTLIDTAPDLTIAANKLLEHYQRGPLAVEAVTRMIGDGVRKLVERAFEASGGAPGGADMDVLAREFLDFYEGHEVDNARPFPGVQVTLNRLTQQGYALGVCTNKPQQPSEAILEAMGLNGYFAAVVGGDALNGARKPDPNHLQVVLERLQADGASAVMVGDSPNDVAVARGLGVPVIAVSYGYTRTPPKDLGADVVIDSFYQLPRALAQVTPENAT